MAGSDPKNVRDAGPTSDRDNYDADEDPLVELARIVSEDVGFSSRIAPKPKIERAAPTVDPDALSSDLEAELMQELETSFSARAAPRAPVEPSVSAEPDYSDAIEETTEDQAEPLESIRATQVEEPPEQQRIEQIEPPDRDDPDDLLRSIEQQLSQFERRVRSGSFADEGDTLRSEENVGLEPRDDWRDEPRPAPLQSEYRFRGPAGVDRERRDMHEDYVAVPDERLEVPTSVADAGEPIVRAALSSDEADEAYAEEQSAPAGETDVGDEDVEREAWAASDEETRAEHGVADLASLEAELSRELDPAYADEDARWPEEAASEDRPHATAAAAVIAPGQRMRPPPRPAQPQRGRSARGLVTAAAILIVVGLGGAAAMYFRSVEQGPAGPPPVIAAQEGPVKIEPAPTQSGGGEEETVGEAVYNRVAGRSSDAQENVVEGAEEPREIERIVPPLRPGSDEPEATEEGQDVGMEADAGTPSAAEEFGPRRVTTYVVRPDGTIVATAEGTSSGGAANSGEQDMAAAQTEAMEPKPVETVVIDEPRTAGTPASPATPLETAPPAVEKPMEEEADAATEIAALGPQEPEPAAEPAAVDEPQEAMAPAAAPTPPTAASGYVVQISSQASQEAAEATFAGLQRRYPSILSELEANIQRADLGERGIYYRVRVGPWADRTDAIDVCEALKTAGADCYVTQ